MRSVKNGQEVISGVIIGVDYLDADFAVVKFRCSAKELKECRREYAHIIRNRVGEPDCEEA